VETLEMKPSLLIMAAGMGSRYGGLKQLDGIGPNGETIIDYSIYDAVRAGFRKIIFVIRHEFEDDMKKLIGNRFGGEVEFRYAHQSLDACLGDFGIPEGREKPWGTAHAVLVAEDFIAEPFVVINADDFYGADAFGKIFDHLAEDCPDYCMVGYELRKTLSPHGAVTRGVCEHDDRMYLSRVVEHLKISPNGDGAVSRANADQDIQFLGDEVVSMNFWGFRQGVFGHLRSAFSDFLSRHGQEMKSEIYIPMVVDQLIQAGKTRVRILPTHGAWFGVTYREDKSLAEGKIQDLISNGIYPENIGGSFSL
jgi:dTDP-glucose pyrophosphorylase